MLGQSVVRLATKTNLDPIFRLFFCHSAALCVKAATNTKIEERCLHQVQI